MPFRLLFALRAVLTGLSLAVLGGTGPAPALTVTENAQAMGLDHFGITQGRNPVLGYFQQRYETRHRRSA